MNKVDAREAVMEDAEHGPAMRRERADDRRHRFFRFDPTVSMGMVIQLTALAIGAGVAYGTYREDQAKIHADIAQLQTAALADRSNLKDAVTDMKVDLREVRGDVRDLNRSIVNLDSAVRAQTPPRNPR